MIEQGIEHRDVIGAGSPVERRFGMAADESRADVGAGRDQFRDAGGVVGKVTGPVGGDVEEGALSVNCGVDKAGSCCKACLSATMSPFRIAVTATEASGCRELMTILFVRNTAPGDSRRN